MTQKVNPSQVRPAEAFKTAGAIALAGASPGWISPAAETSDIASQDAGIDETALNAFAETSGGTSFDVTIDPGEAFVYGSWLAKDTATTITLASSTTGQTVYVGWNKDGTDDVIIGLDSAFASASGDTDEKIPLYDFDTDGSGVTSVTDRRELGQYHSLSHAEIADELGIPVYADTTNAPQEEGNLIRIDGSGADAAGVYSHDGGSYIAVDKSEEEIEDIVNGLLLGGTNITLTYDDANNELTIDTSALDAQEVDDRVNSLLSPGDKLSTTYDDANDTLTIDTTALDAEEVEDQVDSLLVGGTNISYTYDDANDTLTINTSGLNREEVQDAVNNLIVDGNAISTTYDDPNDTLTIDVTEGDIALGNLTGDTDDITEGTNNLYYTDERVDDEVNALVADGNAISSTYDDVNNTLTIAVTETEISLGNLAGDSDNVDEGTTNLYFTDERAQDAVGTIVGSLLNYDDATPSIVIDIGDDQELTFGTGDDVSVRYDSTNDSFRWQDNTNSTDRMELDRTTGNLNIGGEITENASL